MNSDPALQSGRLAEPVTWSNGIGSGDTGDNADAAHDLSTTTQDDRQMESTLPDYTPISDYNTNSPNLAPSNPVSQSLSRDSPQPPPSPSQPSAGAACAPQARHSGDAGGKDGETRRSPYMMAGTLVVIGAIATNVLGFRRSRWAVGKDVHRAWRNYEHAARKREAASEAAVHVAEHAARRMREEHRAFARAEADAFEEFQHAKEHAERQRQHDIDKKQVEDQAARASTHERHEGWERTFSSSFGVDVDPRILQQMFEKGGASQGRNPFGMSEDMLDELLKQAKLEAEKGRSANANARDDFHAFQFWERMANSKDSDSNMGSRDGGGIFSGMGLSRHYSALGLQNGASDSEVKSAYRRQVMKWHPDRYRGDNKEEADRKFREVTDAYNAISGK